MAPLLEDTEKGYLLRQRLGNTLSRQGARHIMAPSPTAFNAKIIGPDEMPMMSLWDDRDTLAYRDPNKPGDITWLEEKGSAYTFSGGGCALVVVSVAEYLFACHGGRDSIINRDWVENGVTFDSTRDYEGILDAIFRKVAPISKHTKNAHVYVFWSIPPVVFTHKLSEQYGERILPYAEERGWLKISQDCVRNFNENAHIDVPAVLRAQAIVYGIPSRNVHLEHAYLPRGMPHTRMQEPERSMRYLAAAIRRS